MSLNQGLSLNLWSLNQGSTVSIFSPCKNFAKIIQRTLKSMFSSCTCKLTRDMMSIFKEKENKKYVKIWLYLYEPQKYGTNIY